MDLLNEALEFETKKMRFPTTSDRIMAARKAKSLILGLNEIYKKNKDGKLVLSYHNREYVFWETISPYMQKLLKLEKDEIKLSYRHEAVVLGIEYKSKNIRVNHNLSVGKDIGDYNIEYQSNFWNNINLPPDSKFYKTSSKQLELLYGIPLENQFKTPK